MSFVEPLFLVGLLAAGLPILVHLINRRKAVVQDFPPLKFLIQSQKRVATGIKVRQWLMMAIRVLVVVFLAFALAKPFYLSESGLTAEERMPTATVYVVDTSLSMASSDWWSNAMDALDEDVGALRPWDEVALVVADAEPRAAVDRLSTNHSDLLDKVGDLRPGAHSADVRESVQLAADMLASSQLPNKRIVVVSDLAKGGLASGEPIQTLHLVEFLDVREVANPASVAIVGAKFEEETGQNEVIWRIDTTIANLGTKDTEVQVELVVDGKAIAASKTNVSKGSKTVQTFRHKFDGENSGVAQVRISADDDALEADNVFTLPVQSDNTTETLIVNGEPSSVVYSDEVFFLERALHPRQDSQSRILPVVTTREGFEGRDLAGFDVVILANVSHVSASAAEKLKAFVESGGGLFITAGDQIDVTAYNQHLAPILPKPLRGLKQLATRTDPDAPIKVTRFGTMRRQHPVFQVFDLPGGDTLQSSVVFSYMLLEPSSDERTETILSYKDAAPALIERRVGKGRVLMLTTSADLDWTDLPTRTAFLPLMQRSVNYLARRATSEGSSDWRAGIKVSLDVGSLVEQRAIVRGPDDLRYVLQPVEGIVEFRAKSPGMYKVYADTDEDEQTLLPNLGFAVNANTADSDLTKVERDQIAVGGDRAQTGAGNKRRVNLWSPILFLVTVLLLLESVVGTRRSVLNRLWRMLTGQPEPTFDDA